MTRFIVLNSVDMLTLQENQPIKIQIDSKPYNLITEEGLNKLTGVKQGLSYTDQNTLQSAT